MLVCVERGETSRPEREFDAAIRGVRVVIGSDSAADWMVRASAVAPFHVELFWDGESMWIADMAGLGDVRVGSRMVVDWTRLDSEMHAQFGAARIGVYDVVQQDRGGVATALVPLEEVERARPSRPHSGARAPAKEHVRIDSEAQFDNEETRFLDANARRASSQPPDSAESLASADVKLLTPVPPKASNSVVPTPARVVPQPTPQPDRPQRQSVPAVAFPAPPPAIRPSQAPNPTFPSAPAASTLGPPSSSTPRLPNLDWLVSQPPRTAGAPLPPPSHPPLAEGTAHALPVTPATATPPSAIPVAPRTSALAPTIPMPMYPAPPSQAPPFAFPSHASLPSNDSGQARRPASGMFAPPPDATPASRFHIAKARPYILGVVTILVGAWAYRAWRIGEGSRVSEGTAPSQPSTEPAQAVVTAVEPVRRGAEMLGELPSELAAAEAIAAENYLAGRMGIAAASYELLAKQVPHRTEFANAARVLRRRIAARCARGEAVDVPCP